MGCGEDPMITEETHTDQQCWSGHDCAQYGIEAKLLLVTIIGLAEEGPHVVMTVQFTERLTSYCHTCFDRSVALHLLRHHQAPCTLLLVVAEGEQHFQRSLLASCRILR